MSAPVTPYGGDHTVVLNGWERRQLAMWAEKALMKETKEAATVRMLVGDNLPKLEAERHLEWLRLLIEKLLPDDEPPTEPTG